MFKNFKFRQILVVALVALVLVAGYVKWTGDQASQSVEALSGDVVMSSPGAGISSSPIPTASAVTVSSGYFADARQNRDKTRSQSLEILNGIVNNAASGAQAKADAQAQISKTAQNVQKEGVVESLVKAKGFADCVVFIDTSSVTVVVKAASLDQTGVAQIQDIVTGQTGYKASQIKISNVAV